MYFSFIVPVYNRPDEIDELLESLTKFTSTIPFEVVIVEDGSTISCQNIIEKYIDKFISIFLIQDLLYSKNYYMKTKK